MLLCERPLSRWRRRVWALSARLAVNMVRVEESSLPAGVQSARLARKSRGGTAGPPPSGPTATEALAGASTGPAPGAVVAPAGVSEGPDAGRPTAAQTGVGTSSVPTATEAFEGAQAGSARGVVVSEAAAAAGSLVEVPTALRVAVGRGDSPAELARIHSAAQPVIALGVPISSTQLS